MADQVHPSSAVFANRDKESYEHADCRDAGRRTTSAGPCSRTGPRGLILHLDAASQVQAAGKGEGNSVWQNLAGNRDHPVGSRCS